MNFLSMEYFLVIVEEGSFSRAAGKLFVSQQSLSEHIKKLEEELGAPLLKRGRPHTLTVAGEAFYRGAKEMLHIRHRTLQEVAQVTSKRRSKITIGIATFDTPPFLPELLSAFAMHYPQYEATVVKRLAADISRNMAGVDLYFSWLPLDPKLEHEILLDDDAFVVVVHDRLLDNVYGSRWPRIEKKLLETKNLSLLQDLPFTILYDKNGFLSRDLEYIFSHYGFSPIVGFQSENGDLNAEMSTNGAGAFLGPGNFCRRKLHAHLSKERPQLRMYEILTPGLRCALALSYEKGKRLNPAELAFIEMTRKVLFAPAGQPL